MALRLKVDTRVAIKHPDIRRELTVALKCTDQTISRYIKDNEADGELTKAAALKVIREALNCEDGDILEEFEPELEDAK